MEIKIVVLSHSPSEQSKIHKAESPSDAILTGQRILSENQRALADSLNNLTKMLGKIVENLENIADIKELRSRNTF